MSIFKHSEDKIPVTIFFIILLADLIVYFNVDNIWFLASWFILMTFPKGNVCSWNHHHQHYFTFKNPISNRLLEIIFGLQTGITGYAWVLHHNYGHHLNYLNQSKDESRWMKKNGKTMNRIRYGLEVTLTSYYRCFIVGLKHPKILKSFLFMAILTFGIVGLLFYYRPLPALFVFILPMITGLYLTADATYPHHSGLDTNNELEASRNITNSKSFNLLSGNLGYHTAHHMKFGIHWSKLPDYHNKIKDQIPDHCFVDPILPYRIIDKVLKL